MPIFLVTSFTAGVLTCDATTIITDRLQTTFVCVLAIVTFKNIVTDKVPAGYTTQLDMYSAWSFLPLTAVVLENCIIGYMVEHNRLTDEEHDLWQIYFLCFFFAVWLVITGNYLLYALKAMKIGEKWLEKKPEWLEEKPGKDLLVRDEETGKITRQSGTATHRKQCKSKSEFSTAVSTRNGSHAYTRLDRDVLGPGHKTFSPVD